MPEKINVSQDMLCFSKLTFLCRHFRDMEDLKKYLPMAAGVVEAYRQRFPEKDANGKVDMWPAQALETYQCHDPTSRTGCPTNPSTDIGGLM